MFSKPAYSLMALGLLACSGVAMASVVVCISPSQPIHQKTAFSPQSAMKHLPTELNTAPWHCSNGVSAPLPALLRGHKLLNLAPVITYSETFQPPFKQESYGRAILDWEKK
ncbi:MAG: hypothetical protein PHO57_02805 [Acidithiobacillus sp.]|jgi:hypothetical protein|nr:hypothetical protein [Acidithiobacillus sp.]